MTDLLSTKAADNLRLARSGSLIQLAAATYNIIRVPEFAFITDAFVVVTVGGSSQTVSVGWIGNGESAAPTALFTTAAAAVDATGTKRSTVGKWFNSAGGMITVTVGTTQTTGNFIVFVKYHVIH